MTSKKKFFPSISNSERGLNNSDNIRSAIFNKGDHFEMKLVFDDTELSNPYYLFADDSFTPTRKFAQDYHHPDVDWTYKGLIRAFGRTNSVNYIVIDEVYVGFNAAISLTKRMNFMVTNYECQNPSELTENNSVFKGIYDLVIGFTLSSYSNYGHFNLDVFPFILHLPPGFLENAYIVATEIPDYQKDYYKAINVTMNHVLSIGPEDYIFARRFITVIPIPCMTKHFYLANHTRQFFVKTFDLDKKKPFRYVIIERKDHRRVAMMDFPARIREEFKEQNWEVFEFKESLEETTKYFNEVLLLSYIDGSGGANALFMQQGTVVLPINIPYFDPFFDVAFLGIGIHIVAIRYQGLSLSTGANYPLPWHLIKTQFETGLMILKREK